MKPSFVARSGSQGYALRMWAWYKQVFQRWLDFRGRSRRAEFWWFALANGLIGFGLKLIEGFFLKDSSALSSIYDLVVLVPSLAVGARRLHDISRSGWWLLLLLLPVVGWVILIIWWVKVGDEGDNAYGPEPSETPGLSGHRAAAAG